MKTLVMLDINNLYGDINWYFKGARLDFKKYAEKLPEDSKVIAYTNQSDAKFLQVLRHLNFQIRPYPGLSCLVDMVLDSVNTEVDNLILGSSNPSLQSLITYYRYRNVQCSIFACQIPKDLALSATKYTEISIDLLKYETPTTT